MHDADGIDPRELAGVVLDVGISLVLGDAEGRGELALRIVAAPQEQPHQVGHERMLDQERLEVGDRPAPAGDHRLLQTLRLEGGHFLDLFLQELPVADSGRGLGGIVFRTGLGQVGLHLAVRVLEHRLHLGTEDEAELARDRSRRGGCRARRGRSRGRRGPRAATASVPWPRRSPPWPRRAFCFSPLNLSLAAMPFNCMRAVSVPMPRRHCSPKTARWCWLSPGQLRMSGVSFRAEASPPRSPIEPIAHFSFDGQPSPCQSWNSFQAKASSDAASADSLRAADKRIGRLRAYYAEAHRGPRGLSPRRASCRR